ncbi:MAG TPA: hypothetical protein VFW40_14360, partial [Capsulimonadaceae bacterium]|nr:hypothetical protein [Capsulimonadaceae bacterium]
MSLSVADNVFMGGAMVTDAYGLPLEFRYTEPVRATKLQRVLYGDVLETYIHTDVILANLLERMDQKPPLYFVSDSAFLAALDRRGRTVVWLTETHGTPLKEHGAIQETSPTEFLLQLESASGPARVRVAPAGASETSPDKNALAALIAEASKSMDILEPLRRVEAAVRLLWEETPEPPPA